MKKPPKKKKPAPKRKTKALKSKSKAPAQKKKPVMEKPIGKVTHYYGGLGVAVLKLTDPLKKGDTVRIEGGEVVVKQKISSLEKDHKKIILAKKGAVVGLKVKDKVRQGYRVYKHS